jgi:hypothetical protein
MALGAGGQVDVLDPGAPGNATLSSGLSGERPIRREAA